MLVIRFRRTGKKAQPNYRIVVTDNRSPLLGKYIEMLGHYNPFTKAVVLDGEKALDWMKMGAKPSNSVAKLMQKQGLKHDSIIVKKFRAVSKKELEAQKAQEEKEKAEEAAKKEAAKAAFEQQVEAEKAAAPSAEEKLQAAAEESIKEAKTEEKAAQATEAPVAEETQKPEPEKEKETEKKS
jgi:small subunit ribosomal protein S16